MESFFALGTIFVLGTIFALGNTVTLERDKDKMMIPREAK